MSDENNIINNEEVFEEQDPIVEVPEEPPTEDSPVEEQPIAEDPIVEEPEDTGPKWYEYDDPNDIDFIGVMFDKEEYDSEAYAAVAAWCNTTQKAYIAEGANGKFYEVVAIPEHTFEELKDIKLAILERKFNTAVSGSFTTTEGYTMQFNETDCNKMNGSITLNKATGVTSDYLVQADNTVIENVPIETMESILLQMLRQYKSMHLKKQIFRAQINAATTKEELNAINIVY